MKNTVKILSLLAFLGLVLNLHAQHKRGYSSHARSDEERVEKHNRSKEDLLIEKLKISKDKEVAFKELFKRYNDEVSVIIRDARKDVGKKDLSDKEIKDRIYARFGVYQKLLDHRKAYTDKFLKVLSPGQLERMFEMEKQIGRFALERKHQMNKSKVKKE